MESDDIDDPPAAAQPQFNMFQSSLDLIAVSKVSNPPDTGLEEIIKLANELQARVPTGQPSDALDPLFDKFIRNKSLEPIMAQLSSTRKLNHEVLKQYLMHAFMQRATTSLACSEPQKDVSAKNEDATFYGNSTLMESPWDDDAWVNLEDLPFFTEKQQQHEEEAEDKDEPMEMSLSQTNSSQAHNQDKISVSDFLEQCQQCVDKDMDADFSDRLRAQSESHLSTLFAACSNAPNLFVPLISAVNCEVKLIGPFSDQILVPMSKKDELDGPNLAKACNLLISNPLVVANRWLVPLIKSSESRSLVIKVLKYCQKEEVNLATLNCLLNSGNWVAKIGDLELLQCLLNASIPTNPVSMQLLCQMFASAEDDLKVHNDYAKLLLQIIKAFQGEMTDACKNLLMSAVASVKSPLSVLMKKQLAKQ
jgi:hypothetical protein